MSKSNKVFNSILTFVVAVVVVLALVYGGEIVINEIMRNIK